MYKTCHKNPSCWLPITILFLVFSADAEKYQPKTVHDVDLLSNGHILVTEGGSFGVGIGSGVYEIDRSGEIHWSYDQGLLWAHDADRLPSGNTLIGSGLGIIEINPNGNTVWSYPEGLAPIPAGGEVITHVDSPENGLVAIRLRTPVQSRYPEGAPIVVSISTFLTTTNSFGESVTATDAGMIGVSYLWPGKTDPATGASSEGTYDYGGPLCMAALRDVVRFACGLIPNASGDFIGDLLPVIPLTDNVGLYAFSHPGIAATNLMAQNGTVLPNVKYFVGGENPTVDTLTAVEAGHWAENGAPIANPHYNYPQDYSPVYLDLDFSRVGWIQNLQYPEGRPFFSVDGGPDYILGDRVPKIGNKRLYSIPLTQALVDNGAVAQEAWPADLATVTDTLEYWPSRMTVHNYPTLATSAAQLKVLLAFAEKDHVQPALDKPHIHQAYDGFKGGAGLWVRLNPDLAYVQQVEPGYGNTFPDIPANWQPADWSDMRTFGYPKPTGLGDTNKKVGLAGVAEMADRVRMGVWDNNLDAVLVEYPRSGGTYDVAPIPSDGNVNALDLLWFLRSIRSGTDEERILFDFSGYWMSTLHR